eukprot:EG_transcript_1923
MYGGTSHVSGLVPQRVPFNVQDYKDKRAAQLERARRIREERDQRKPVPVNQDQFQHEQPKQEVAHRLSPSNPVDEMPIRAASNANQQVQRAQPVVAPARRKTFDTTVPPPSSSDSTSSTNSYGYDSVGSNLGKPVDNRVSIPAVPATKAEGAKISRTGEALLVNENDVSSAVVAGIINLEQAGRLWRHLLNKEGRPTSAPLQPSVPDYAPDPRFRPTDNTDPPIKLRSAREQPTDYYATEIDTPPQPSRSRKPGWNFDTEVSQNDNLSPEPLPAQTQAQRRPGPGPRQARTSKPDWNGDFADARSTESYDEPPTHAQPQRPTRGVGVAQPPGAAGFPGTTMGSNQAADKLSLLKGRAPARAGSGIIEKPTQYASGITYEASPFGTAPSPPRPAAQPQRQGYKGGLTAYTRPAEEEYTTGRIIESEEERIAKADRNSQLEVDMYEANSNMPMRECHVCGRSFRQDRIAKHTVACEKSNNKKRKVFDMTKQRLDGEALKVAKEAKRYQKPEPVKKEGALPKWKQQHLEFQHALKAGKAADDGYAPPPPPVDTREECPYCGRRFASDVAERHIPKCKNIVNKPKSTFRR